MLSKWKANVSAVGAFLLAVITWLAFFGVDARTIRAQLTTHYIFLIAALICTFLFVLSLRYLWRVTRVTPENIHLKIRQWLDTFNVSHRVVPFEPWYLDMISLIGDTYFLLDDQKLAADASYISNSEVVLLPISARLLTRCQIWRNEGYKPK